MIDCVIIGYNDSDYRKQIEMARSCGETAPFFRDKALNFIEVEGEIYRSMDILNHLLNRQGVALSSRLHNADFLWPVVAYLSTFLERQGFSTDYVNLFQQDKPKLHDLLLSKEVEVVAITTTLYVDPFPIREIVSFIRQYNRRVKIVVGGPFVLNLVKASGRESLIRTLRFIDADYFVVSSEGEATLANLLRALKEGGLPEEVPNLACRSHEGYSMTPVLGESNGLAENMIDYSRFPGSQIGQFVSLRTAKSCPFACAFCNFPEVAGKYTYLPVDLVERELDAIQAVGTVTTLTFVDDTFNVPKTRFKEILRLMIRKNYGFRWNSFLRCDHSDDETIELMREAGCEGVFLGIESGSDRMLKLMNKTASSAIYRETIPKLRRAGILTNASLVVGFPGETEESLRETIDFLEEARPDFFGANLWYHHPSTPAGRRHEELGIEGEGYEWSHRTMDSRTAIAAVEKMFREVEGSLWLPEDGFELWSVFYLQRKGMPLMQVKEFIRRFNQIVRLKLDGIVSGPVFDREMEALEECVRILPPQSRAELGGALAPVGMAS